jgi:hypothetical protein
MALPNPQQRREREGDLKEFAFHRVTSSPVPASLAIGELLGFDRKKGHLFEVRRLGPRRQILSNKGTEG